MLTKSLEFAKICPGTGASDAAIKHTVVMVQMESEDSNDDTDEEAENPYPLKVIAYREKNCNIILEENDDICDACRGLIKEIEWTENRSEKKRLQPAKRNAPLSNTDPQRVVLALLESRTNLRSSQLQCKELECQLEEMKEELARSHIMVDYELHSDFMAILSQSDRKMTPFISLFWEQQVH